MSYTTARNCHHHRTTKPSKTCCTQQQITVTIREQQNINTSYTTANNCHHQRTTKNINMSYTTASNCHHQRTTKHQHVIHNSKQLSPSENNKMSNKRHTQQHVTVIIREQQNANHMSYTAASNCHNKRTKYHLTSRVQLSLFSSFCTMGIREERCLHEESLFFCKTGLPAEL